MTMISYTSSNRKWQGGYVALMATIVISMALLVMVAEEGFAGWHARFNVLGTEHKEQANALAEGCADQALAALITDPSYSGAILNTLPSGTCYVSPIDTSSNPGKALIRVQSQVGGVAAGSGLCSGGATCANLAQITDIAQIHIGQVDATSTAGTLVVQTIVHNHNNTVASSSDFTMHVAGISPSLSQFDGLEAGRVVHVLPGSYNVTQTTALTGYSTSQTSECSGSIKAGEVKTCTFVNSAVLTTLTLVATVVNDNKGQKQPTDFNLLLDGVTVPFAEATDVLIGPHTLAVATSSMSGYLASDWTCVPQSTGSQNGTNGQVDATTGDNKICIVKLDDIPPPNPSCADTVMMLDRTGGSASVLPDEKTAANSFVSLYALVAPPLAPPSLGVGSFGGLDGSAASIPTIPSTAAGLLTTVYSRITSAITAMMGSTSSVGSDLSAGIAVGNAELASTRHQPANEKVLIFVSDGNPNKPTGSSVASTSPLSPSANAQNATSDSWTTPTNAYTATDTTADANALATSGKRHQFYNFNFPNIPTGSTISGIEADVDAWATATGGSASTSALYPASTGNFTQWLPTGSTKDYSATADSNTGTYIDTTGAILSDTMAVANASTVPSGATINSVTLYVRAEGTAAGATMNLVVAKDATHVVAGPTVNLTNGSYQLYSYVFPKQGDGSSSWTQSEVTNWTNTFGVRTTAGVLPRVSQVYVVVNYTSSTASSGSSATLAPSSVGSGSWSSASSAFLSDNVYATDATSGHQQLFGNFGFTIPSGASIQGIQLWSEAKASGTSAATNSSTLYPTSSGNYSAWSGSYSDIDESGTTDCSSTDAIITSTSNDRSSVKLSLSAIPDGSIINSVSITPSDRSDSSGTSGTYKTFVRLNGANTDAASAITVTSTSGCTSRSAQTIAVSATKSSSTNLEIGVLKVNGGSSNGVRVGALNATINYTPPVSGSLTAELSWNNNSSRSSSESISVGTTEAVTTPSGNNASDTWGSHSWTSSDFANGNFVVRLTNNSSTGTTVSLDQLTAKVSYTTTTTVNAPTNSLYPNAAGDFTQWIPTGSTKDYSTLADASDSTYIDTASATLTDTMSVANASTVPAGATISGVTLFVSAQGANGSTLQLVAEKSSSQVVTSPVMNLTTSYQTYSYTFPTTGDSKAWTQAEVANWTNDFGVRTTGGSPIPRVSQAYVVVTYTLASNACQLGMDLSYDGGAHWTPSTEKTVALGAARATYALGTSTDTWSRTWSPTDFTNANFRARVHAAGGTGCQASAVEHLDWLRMKVFYSQPVAGSAALTAADTAKLSGTDIFTIYYSASPNTTDQGFLAQLASGLTPVAGHQNGSYADPGGVVTGSTVAGPTSAVAPSQWSNPTAALKQDNTYTTDTGGSAHQQAYGSFGLVVPPAATVTGVEVDLTNAKTSSGSGCKVGVELSSDGGTTWTASGTQSSSLTNSYKSYTAPASNPTTYLWGRPWTSTDFDAGKFLVRLQNIHGSSCSSGVTLSLDQVSVKVRYSVNQENSDGDNFFIAPTTADIPGIFDFIGNQVCPAARPVPVIPPTTSSLLVITRTINDNAGTKQSSDFTVTVNPYNQIQISSDGMEAPGANVTFFPGTYGVTEQEKVSSGGYTTTYSPECTGAGTTSSPAIAAGETRVCIVTNDDIPPPPPLDITPGAWQEVPSNY